MQTIELETSLQVILPEQPTNDAQDFWNIYVKGYELHKQHHCCIFTLQSSIVQSFLKLLDMSLRSVELTDVVYAQRVVDTLIFVFLRKWNYCGEVPPEFAKLRPIYTIKLRGVASLIGDGL